MNSFIGLQRIQNGTNLRLNPIRVPRLSRVLKHTADTSKPVETGYSGPSLSVFQHTLISSR